MRGAVPQDPTLPRPLVMPGMPGAPPLPGGAPADWASLEGMGVAQGLGAQMAGLGLGGAAAGVPGAAAGVAGGVPGGGGVPGAAGLAGAPPAVVAPQGPPIDLTCFLHVAAQLLWQLDPFKAQLAALTTPADPLVSGVQMLMAEISKSRASEGSPALSPALLHTALQVLYAEQTRNLLESQPLHEMFETVLTKFCEARDSSFVSNVEKLLNIGVLEMCECECGEMLEPMSYKNFATAVSVAQIVGNAPAAGQPSSLVTQLGQAAGPACPSAACGSRMSIVRYLMPPVPGWMCVALQYPPRSGPPESADISTLLQRVDLEVDLQRAFRGVLTPLKMSLRGVLCSAATRCSAYFLSKEGATQGSWVCFDDDAVTTVGDEFGAVVSRCAFALSQPALLFYEVNDTGGATECVSCAVVDAPSAPPADGGGAPPPAASSAAMQCAARDGPNPAPRPASAHRSPLTAPLLRPRRLRSHA